MILNKVKIRLVTDVGAMIICSQFYSYNFHLVYTGIAPDSPLLPSLWYFYKTVILKASKF